MEETDRLSFKGRRGKPRSVIEKFWDYVEKLPQPECWRWRGHHDEHGYPRIAPSRSKRRLNNPYGNRRSPLKASRVSWEIHNTRIPLGLHVLHRCDNPGCVNPEHLFLGTHQDNMRDMFAKGRYRKLIRRTEKGNVLCKNGHIKELLPNEIEKYVCPTCQLIWQAAYRKRREAGHKPRPYKQRKN